MLIKSFLFVFMSLTNFAADAAKPMLKAAIDLKPLNDATAKYRSAKLVKSDLIKFVKSELTGKETKNEGEIAISEGLFRLENKGAEKSLIVFDGTTLWNEQKPSDDFGGPVQVTSSVIGKKNKSQTFFATMLTREPVTKYFKILTSKVVGSQVHYEAESTTTEINVKDFKLIIDSKKKEVIEISFKDDIGNLTTMKFSNTKFQDSSNRSLFKYKPPKGAQETKI